MNKNKWFGIVIVYLLFAIVVPACSGYEVPIQVMQTAPLEEGEVYNMFQGTARWLANNGDILVKSFYNPNTGVLLHSRPLMDGYAVACENVHNWNTLVGYFTNIKTWNNLKEWLLGAGGFSQIARELIPQLRMPTIMVM